MQVEILPQYGFASVIKSFLGILKTYQIEPKKLPKDLPKELPKELPKAQIYKKPNKEISTIKLKLDEDEEKTANADLQCPASTINENLRDNSHDSPHERRNDASEKTQRQQFSRNPLSYRRYFDSSSNDSLDLLSMFQAAFTLIIGTTIVLNCFYRYFDMSNSNILYLLFASRKENYWPLILTGIFMIIFTIMSIVLKPLIRRKHLIYLYAIAMIMFSVMLACGSLLVIERRYSIESTIHNRINFIMNDYDSKNSKSLIDYLQTNFYCCGNQKFSDWYAISWTNQTARIPESCCLHNGKKCIEEQTSNKQGCKSALLLYFSKYYGDYLIGVFGSICSVLLSAGAFFSLKLTKKNRYIYFVTPNQSENVFEFSCNHKNIA